MYFTVDDEFDSVRIDKALSMLAEDFTRSHIQILLEQNAVKVNGKPVFKSCRLSPGDVIEFAPPEPKDPDIKPENIPLDIVYEDGDLLVVNKPRGMVVHPAPGNYNGTLVNALMYHCKDNLSGINTPRKLGPVLRLADTVVVTKGDVVSQAEREIFAYNIRLVNPRANILQVNGITGQGAFLLAKNMEKTRSVDTLSGMQLRFTTPSSVCAYCTGERRIGMEYHLGMNKAMEFE